MRSADPCHAVRRYSTHVHPFSQWAERHEHLKDSLCLTRSTQVITRLNSFASVCHLGGSRNIIMAQNHEDMAAE